MVHVHPCVPVGAPAGREILRPAPGDRDDDVPAVLRQAQSLGRLGQVRDPARAVQEGRCQQAHPVLPPPGQLPLGLPVGVRHEGAVLVDEVPHVGGHVHEQPDVLGLRAGGLLDQPLPHQGPAQPERVQQGVQRQSLLGAGDADPPGAAVGGLAGAARVEQRRHAVPQRAADLLPGGGVVVLQRRPVRRFLFPQDRQQPVGQIRQVVEQDAGGAVQDTQRVGVDQRPDPPGPRLRDGGGPGAERRTCACGRMHGGPPPASAPRQPRCRPGAAASDGCAAPFGVVTRVVLLRRMAYRPVGPQGRAASSPSGRRDFPGFSGALGRPCGPARCGSARRERRRRSSGGSRRCGC